MYPAIPPHLWGLWNNDTQEWVRVPEYVLEPGIIAYTTLADAESGLQYHRNIHQPPPNLAIEQIK